MYIYVYIIKGRKYESFHNIYYVNSTTVRFARIFSSFLLYIHITSCHDQTFHQNFDVI